VFAALRFLTEFTARKQLPASLVIPLVPSLGFLDRSETQDEREYTAAQLPESAAGPVVKARVVHDCSSFGGTIVRQVAQSPSNPAALPPI
jgi:hypothetical protein